MLMTPSSFSLFLPDSKRAVEVLNHCLDSGVQLDVGKHAEIKPGKVPFVQKSMMQTLDYHPALYGVALPLKEHVQSLGVFLDAQMVTVADIAATISELFKPGHGKVFTS